MLSSIRETMTKYISENSYEIKTWKRPLVNNGYDQMVPDLTKVAIEETLGTARIARRRLPDVLQANAKTPYDYQDVYYMLAEYDAAWLVSGIVFDYYGQKFRTLFVENRIIDGGIAYKLCNLEQATSSDIGDFYGS